MALRSYGPLARLPGRLATAATLTALSLAGTVVAGQPAGAATTFLGGLPNQSTVASTLPVSNSGLPGDGDVNPYGVAVIHQTLGHLIAGNILVSNFNNSSNLQGTGRTIVEVSPSGDQFTFACLPELAGGTGLSTALAVLPNGFVIVGSLPTSDGTAATATAGVLVVLDRTGAVVETISGGDINGPWDLTAAAQGDHAEVFVTNVLNDTVADSPNTVDGGTVVRVDLAVDRHVPKVLGETVIGSGFPERTDPAALVIGPTGDGLAPNGTLYVADSLGNSINAIPDALHRNSSAGQGVVVSPTGAGNMLNDPLGLAVAPNGDILTVNGDDGNIVETTPAGAQVDFRQLDGSGSPPGAGALFGLAVGPGGQALYFVDDATNTLDALTG